MNWKASPPAIETVTVAIATTSLGTAVAFAIFRTAPSGVGPAHALVVGTIVALLGWGLIGRVDRRQAAQSFVAAATLEVAEADADILLLDENGHDAEADALLLDDPLPVLSDDMRVVRLFTADPAAVGGIPPVGPAEMIARIEDFLGQPRGSASTLEAPRDVSDAASRDASAALHLALADIRRSLRQA